MTQRYILALDQGTTSSRAILYNEAAEPVAVSQQAIQQYFPQPGWVEHDAVEIWDKQRAVAREVIDRAGIHVGDLAAVGITNQRETTVIWERATGRPIHPAIVWQDRRTSDYCRAMRDRGECDRIAEKTGLLLDAYFSATKVQWLLEHVDGARARAEAGELAFGTMDCWLAWNLSGEKAHITDAGNASRTLLFNIHTLEWDAELLELVFEVGITGKHLALVLFEPRLMDLLLWAFGHLVVGPDGFICAPNSNGDGLQHLPSRGD